MIAKNNNPFELIKNKNLDPAMRIYFQLNHLKQLLRQGWLEHIPREKCESVADHCFGASLLALLIAEKYFPKLDISKVITMSLIHDLGEIYAGDITPFDNVSGKEKHDLEKRGIRRLFSDMPETKAYLKLWEEYEKNESPEAKFVRQIDKLEMAFQAVVYARQYGENLDEFLESARKKIEDEKLLKLLDEVENA